ncbi:unnamed protein product [Sphagnum tenellum]
MAADAGSFHLPDRFTWLGEFKMSQEDDDPQTPCQDGEDRVHADALLVEGDGSGGEAAEGQDQADEERVQHVAGGGQARLVGVCSLA